MTVLSCLNNSTGPANKTDAPSVAADKSALTITYLTGDSAGSVTGNVRLAISGANGSSISWVTSNSDQIATNGKVTRPTVGSGDTVTLTATIAKGTASDVKVFSLIVKSITIISGGTVTDTDGNVYHTVKIGNQFWTVENLRTTKYNDGSAIPHVTSDAAWATAFDAYCYYNNTTNSDTINKFGALYNWYAVNTGKLAPVGWHVPTDSEWEVMQNYLAIHGYGTIVSIQGINHKTFFDAIAIALAAKTDRYSDTITGTIGKDLTQNNSSGFSALPGGERWDYGGFDDVGSVGYWWSATFSAVWVNSYVVYIGGSNGNFERSGFSVRLVKDN